MEKSNWKYWYCGG